MVLAAVCWGSPSIAADWRFLNAARVGENRAVMFVDAESVKVNGLSVRYWKDTRNKFNVGTGAYSVNRLVDLVEAHCDEMKYRALSSGGYLDDQFVIDLEADSKWKFAIPDTIMYSEIRRVCSQKWGETSVDRKRAAEAIFDRMN